MAGHERLYFIQGFDALEMLFLQTELYLGGSSFILIKNALLHIYLVTLHKLA